MIFYPQEKLLYLANLESRICLYYYAAFLQLTASLVVSALNVLNVGTPEKICVFLFNAISLKWFPLAFVLPCLQYHSHKLGLLAETNLKDIYCWKVHPAKIEDKV